MGYSSILKENFMKKQNSIIFFMFLFFIMALSTLFFLSKENGNIKSYSFEETVKCREGFRCNLSGNLITGIVTKQSKTGTLISEISFKNGKKDGIEKKYHEDGTLKSKITYKNGNIEGSCRFSTLKDALNYRDEENNAKCKSDVIGKIEKKNSFFFLFSACLISVLAVFYYTNKYKESYTKRPKDWFDWLIYILGLIGFMLYLSI